MQLPSLLPPFLLLLSFVLLHFLKQLKRGKPNLPPGPWQLPFIGSIHHLARDAIPHHYFLTLAHKYGPLFQLKLGQINFIVASNSTFASEILKTHDQIFASRPTTLGIKIMGYNSIGMGFSPHGPYWRQLRKICSEELLSSKKVKSFGYIREEEAIKMVEKIRLAGGSKVNMTEVFLELVNGHITRAVLGKECASKKRFFKVLKEMMKLLQLLSPAELFPAFGFLISAVDGSRGKMRRISREMDEILDEIVAEHVAREEGEGEVEEDFVDVLLRVKEKGELQFPLAVENVKAVLLDMFVGTETTSVTLDWVMTELIRHPEIMRKAQLEVREAIRGKTRIEESDINELYYLKMIIKETLRLHPALPLLIPRICSKETVLLGFTIPVKSWVIVNAWAIGRDPEIWENPESFCPDRFKECAVDFKGENYEYIPFGAGRRICPGITFSLASMEYFLAHLLLHFDWVLPNGRDPKTLDMEERGGGSARRKNDLCLLGTPYSLFDN